MSQPRAGQNIQWHSTRRAGRNIQPTNKSEKLIKKMKHKMWTCKTLLDPSDPCN